MDSTVSIELGLMEEPEAVDADLGSETEQDQDIQLHTALRIGRTAKAISLLDDGVSATKTNEEGSTSLDTAAKAATRGSTEWQKFFAVLSKATTTRENTECFKAVFSKATKINEGREAKHQTDIVKKFNEVATVSISDIKKDPEAWRGQLRKAIEELSPVQLYCATTSEYQRSMHSLWTKLQTSQLPSIENGTLDSQVAVVQAILDRCVFGGKLVVTNMLEDDDRHGYQPTCRSGVSDGNDGSVSLFFYLGGNPRLFSKLVSHPALRAVVENQWRKKRKIFWLQFLYYLFQMLVLTCALAIAARPGLTDAEINTYPAPVDYFRGICEGILLAIILATVANEIIEIVYTPCETYILDVMNYYQWSSLLLTLMIVPFRIWNHPGQWIVASLAYVFNSLKATEHTALFGATGDYVYTLRRILFIDVSKFLLVFLSILITFTGSFYLSLRYDDSAIVFDDNGTLVSGGGLNSDQMNLMGEGREYYEVLFTGLRSFLETGSVLTYYGRNGGFRALSVILYLAFLFIVVIILSNVLIAQMSDTYTTVRAEAQAVVLRSKCWYMAKLRDQRLAACMPYTLYRLFRRLAIQHCCPAKGRRDASRGGRSHHAINIAWVDREGTQSFEKEMESKMDELANQNKELAKQLGDLKSILEKTAAPGQQQA